MRRFAQACAIATALVAAAVPASGAGKPGSGDLSQVLLPEPTVEDVLAVLSKRGLAVKPAVEQIDEYLAEVDLRGVATTLFFSSCEAGRRVCARLSVFAQLDAPKTVDLAKVDEWNRRASWVTAFVDLEGKLNLSFERSLRGGLPLLVFDRDIDVFSEGLVRLQQEFKP
jgi:hypothetical protein